MQVIGDNGLQIVPNVLVTGSTGQSGITEALIGLLLRSQAKSNGLDGIQPLKSNGDAKESNTGKIGGFGEDVTLS
jgi:hypothetical protein